MPQFQTTAQTTAAIERIIDNAQEEITLISPYLQISKIFFERLVDASKRRVKISIVYGKKDLKDSQEKEIRTIPRISLYYMDNLHAKCYYNEKELIITSMNLHSYSEKNNREMGVHMTSAEDQTIYSAAKRECLSILQHANPISVQPQLTPNKATNSKTELSYKNWKEELHEELSTIFEEKVTFRDGPNLNFKSHAHNLDLFIEFDKNSNRLVIAKILSNLLYTYLKSNPAVFSRPLNSKLILESGGKGKYDMAYCELKTPLKTEKLSFVSPADIEPMYQFVLSYAKAMHHVIKQFKEQS
jgi:hypothetical protein